MLKKIKEIFSKHKLLKAEDILKYPKGRRIYTDFHTIRKSLIDPDAAKIVNRLQQHNYKAYIVGGSIRDLLLGRQPKDFDIVTNARPNEVKRIFSNSRLIGRRFRIVHVVFRGNKIIEVSTARSLPKSREIAKETEDLYLEKDNQYGTFPEDAARRDFTINSLFFDMRNETIIDYTGGFEDLQNKTVRMIGPEDISLPEDPVRMLRAVKFASLLDFELTEKLSKGIRRHKKLILKAAPARLHEEYNKIFRTGHSAKIFAAMHETELYETLFPRLSEVSFSEGMEFSQSSLATRLKIADRMISEHEDINTTIYYLLVITDLVREEIKQPPGRGRLKRLKELVNAAEKELSLTRKESETILQALDSQSRFGKAVKDRTGWVKDFQQKEYFLEAFIFYKILARSENDDEAIQKALFWEIGLRKKLPHAIRKQPDFHYRSPKPANK